MANERLIIDIDSRRIIIPASESVFGVSDDDRAERKWFSCPRYVGDGIDMTKASVSINYSTSPLVIRDKYIVTDLEADGENVVFSWLLNKQITKYNGEVNFIVCAQVTDASGNIEKRWNTAAAKGRVLQGIKVEISNETDEAIKDYEHSLEQKLLAIGNEIEQRLQQYGTVDKIARDGVAELSEEIKDIEKEIFTHTINIFDESNITVGLSLQSTIGRTFEDNSDTYIDKNRFVSNQIFKIKKGDIIYTNKGYGTFNFYNADKKMISQMSNGNLENNVTMEDAKYLRYGGDNTDTYVKNFMLSINNPLPSEYVGYGGKSRIGGIEKTLVEISKEQDETNGKISAIQRKTDALFNIAQGQTLDTEYIEDNGEFSVPSGAMYVSVDEVRGKSEQYSTNGYQLIDDRGETFPKTSANITFNKNGNEYTFSGNGEGYPFVAIGYADLISGETYCLSYDWVTNVSSRVVVDGQIIHTNNGYFMSTVTAKARVDIVLPKNYSAEAQEYIKNIMLEKGSTAHPYEPYTGGKPSPSPDNPQEIISIEKFTIYKSNVDGTGLISRTITPPRPLRRIGEYIDRADIENGVWEYNVGSYDFKSTDNWVMISDGKRAATGVLKNLPNPVYFSGAAGDPTNGVMCDLFKSDGNIIDNFMRIWINWNGDTIIASNDLSEKYTAQEIKNMMVGKNVIYQYSKPETEEINAEDLAFLRSLETMSVREHVFIEDQNGNPVKFLSEYIIKLSEV